MRGSTFYRTVEYFGLPSNGICEIDLFPVFQSFSPSTGKKARRRKCKPSSEVQAALNQHNAERRLIRLIHSNFTEEDLTIHLTYRYGWLPDSDDRAKKDIQNYLKCIKRRYAKAGKELKYICVTEKGSRSGRYHHHLIVNGIDSVDRDELERMWKFGRANSRRLQFGEDGVAGLAVYILKQAEVWGKRWCASRNLVEPQEKVNDYKMSKRDAATCAGSFAGAAAVVEKLYPGWELVSLPREMENEVNGGYYVTLRLRRIDDSLRSSLRKTERRCLRN